MFVDSFEDKLIWFLHEIFFTGYIFNGKVTKNTFNSQTVSRLFSYCARSGIYRREEENEEENDAQNIIKFAKIIDNKEILRIFAYGYPSVVRQVSTADYGLAVGLSWTAGFTAWQQIIIRQKPTTCHPKPNP